MTDILSKAGPIAQRSELAAHNPLGPWFESRWAHSTRACRTVLRLSSEKTAPTKGQEEELRDQLKRLEELQRYDAQIQELTNALKAIPAKLEASQTDFARVESLLNSERSQLSESQRYYSEQKGQLQTEESSASGAKNKLSMAKNSKEYVAAQREIEQTRESVQNREQEIAKLIEAVQVKEKLLSERAAELEVLRKSIDKDRRGRPQEDGRAGRTDRGHQGRAATRLPQASARTCSSATAQSACVVGWPSPTVRNGTCQGCNMNVPPQLFNVLQRGTTIETCPYCHRIVYWENPDEGRPGARIRPLPVPKHFRVRYTPRASRWSSKGGRDGEVLAVEESPGSPGQGAG